MNKGVFMNINEAGLKIIKECEGCWLKAYLCPSGKQTIGYGHTGPDVKENLIITQDRAEEILRSDIKRFEAALNDKALVKNPINSNQFSALVSFCFNVGIGAFQTSTMLKKINTGDFKGAAAEFDRWVFATNKEKLPGLVKRRALERALFEKK
jgi:lysozyme